MASKKKYSEYTPAWAGYHGEMYTSGFSGTPEQKKASDKAVAELFSKRGKATAENRKSSCHHRLKKVNKK